MKREQFIMRDLLFFGGHSPDYDLYYTQLEYECSSELEDILMDVEENTIDFRNHIMFSIRMSIK